MLREKKSAYSMKNQHEKTFPLDIVLLFFNFHNYQRFLPHPGFYPFSHVYVNFFIRFFPPNPLGSTTKILVFDILSERIRVNCQKKNNKTMESC